MQITLTSQKLELLREILERTNADLREEVYKTGRRSGRWP
jgi:hypothetical protein